MSQSTTTIISQHNDQFRRGDGSIPGNVVVTIGIQELIAEADKQMSELFEVVRAFDTFTDDNDPYGEHDFGQFDFAGTSCFWKIDLYNPTLDGGTECPTDLEKTHRVLTIMLAREY